MGFGEIAQGFGVEIEFKGGWRAALDSLRYAGLSVEFVGYSHRVTPHWKIVTDGTVVGGYELVSPILRGEDGISEARRAVEALRLAGMTVDRQCGFHVHLDASGMTVERMRNLVKMFAKYEDTMDALMPRSRRKSHNIYCKSLVPELYDAQTPEERKAVVDTFFARIDRCTTLEEIQRAIPGHAGQDRNYAKLNVGAYWRHGTVEFRQHAGTLDGAKVETWLRFVDAFYGAACKAKRIAPRLADERKGADLLPALCKGVVDGTILRKLRERAAQFGPSGLLRRSAAGAEA